MEMVTQYGCPVNRLHDRYRYTISNIPWCGGNEVPLRVERWLISQFLLGLMVTVKMNVSASAHNMSA
jgi:hypothetical protein|tara:strand:- start:52 stop:252 length:201 start_codon:yes stop_codon:yes gene_type:complete